MRWIFALFVLLLLGLPAAAVLTMVEREPLVSRTAAGFNMGDLHRAQALAERYDPRRMSPQRVTTVRATADELNTLLRGAIVGVPRVASRVEVSRFGVLAGVTVELPVPENPLGRYVNIRTLVAPSERGLEISRFAVGRVEIPPSAIRPAMRLGLDRLVGAGKGEPILGSVKSVRVAGSGVSVAFQPPPTLVADIKAVTRTHTVVSDPTTVRAYYDAIDRTVAGLPRHSAVSLVEVMRPVFRLARERSAARDPRKENEAALLAVAIYFGDGRFAHFVGPVLSEARKKEPRELGRFRLDGRSDFVQHFTISMGLTLTGGDFAANIIGELKEASDSRGSSGFSFTDIGADRLGVQFAKLAVSRHDAAIRVQQIMSEARQEQVFFPRFADLPEGMSEAAFRRRYGDVGSTQYRSVIAEIDRRIAGAHLFR
jgi:hypothetical protein